MNEWLLSFSRSHLNLLMTNLQEYKHQWMVLKRGPMNLIMGKWNHCGTLGGTKYQGLLRAKLDRKAQGIGNDPVVPATDSVDCDSGTWLTRGWLILLPLESPHSVSIGTSKPQFTYPVNSSCELCKHKTSFPFAHSSRQTQTTFSAVLRESECSLGTWDIVCDLPTSK